ncbi:MAG: hypothetical protein Tsb0015_03220 [Simkaniaceae bacterium]
MSDNYIRQNAFKKIWERESCAQSPEKEDSFSAMRTWQIDAFNDLKGAPLMILNAPMGSGKSWLMCALAAFKMEKDLSLRTVIGVPQSIIASGFTRAKLTLPNGAKINWKVTYNLCAESKSDRRTTNELIDWLANPLSDFEDRILLCTHSTLLRAFRKLEKEKRLDLLSNLLLWLDEAHHVMNTASEDFPEIVDSNGIGQLVEHLLSQPVQNVQLGLTTASFFRGDRRALLTPDMESKFARYNLPYDKYLESMKHLQSFSFDFLICGYDYINGIEALVKQKRGKDIIWVPHPNSLQSTRKKTQEVQTIIDKYHAIYGGKPKKDEKGITILGEAEQTFKIIDLVDDHPIRRSLGKSYIRNPVLNKDQHALDAIIALNMFKEGANWIWADRAIIVGTRSSLVDIIQMIGRVFRDAEGKKHAEVIQLLPFSLDQKDDKGFRENLNDYLKAIYASLILENILDPVKIKAPSAQAEEKTDKKPPQECEKKIEENWLKIAVPDESKQHVLIEKVGSRLMQLKAESSEIMSWNDHKIIAEKVLEENGITEHKKEVAQQILGIFARKTFRLQGISVGEIDFDIVKMGEPLDFLLIYTSGACNISTFKDLREAVYLSREWKDFESAREWVRKLNLKGDNEWREYVAGKRPDLPSLPDDIPKAPWAAYKEKGYTNLGDFLGTHVIAPRLRKYRSYEEAQKFAQSLGLKRKEDWPAYTKGLYPGLPPLPADIAVCPDKTYRRKDYGKKWKGWGDFLGTGTVSNQNKAKIYWPYEKASKFAKSLKLNSSIEWRKYISGSFPNLPPLPLEVPKKPNQVYPNFQWHEFLGSKINKMNCRREFWPFEKARQFVVKLGLKRFEDWVDYCAGKLPHLPKKPLEVPSNPQKKYKDTGWKGYAYWMGY